MTTFNTPYRHTDENVYANVNSWLDAFFSAQNLLINQNFSITSIDQIQKILNYQFKNQNLLINAFTHKSFYYENKSLVTSDNEKLEFLGDSVLNFIVTKYLLKNFPDLSEGDLSKLRGSLVNEDSFAKLAREIHLSCNLFIGKGEYKNSGFDKNSILADAFEALFGAILTDSNFDQAEIIFWNVIHLYESNQKIAFINLANVVEFDSKSKLQELMMAKTNSTPIYKSIEIPSGFKVELWSGDRMLHSLDGVSKKKVEKELAKYVLDHNLI